MSCRIAIIFLLTVALNGCATSAFRQSWSAPDANAYPLGKTVAFAMLPVEADRRRSEDLFAQVLAPAMDVTAGYAVVAAAPAGAPDLAKAKAQAARQGFGSVLVVKVVSTRDELVYQPGVNPFFGPGFGYPGRRGMIGHPFMMDPGYYEKVRIAVVELSLYASRDDHLLWTASTEVLDSSRLDRVVRVLADAMLKDLLAKGVLP